MKYVITGNGVAGVNAAMAIRAKDPSGEIYIISRETDYYYSRTALMYIIMGMSRLKDTEPLERHEYHKNNLILLRDTVSSIDTRNKTMALHEGGAMNYDKLLLAQGAAARKPPLENIAAEGVTYFVSWQDLVELEKQIKAAKTKKAVVVGGGLIGVEVCEVLHHFGFDVDFIIRGNTFLRSDLSQKEGDYAVRHIEENGIRVHTDTSLTSIHTENGRVSGVTTTNGDVIPCSVLNFAIGVVPRTALAKSSGLRVNKGIITNWQLECSNNDVWAAGDCAEIEIAGSEKNFTRTIWYSARDMGIIAGRNMAGADESYNPGYFYNSAKFFEKEYTAAGRNVAGPGDQEHFFIDEQLGQAIRVVHHSGICKGFSTVGGRWEHNILNTYIDENRSIDYFFDNYEEALFDPEFYPVPKIKE